MKRAGRVFLLVASVLAAQAAAAQTPADATGGESQDRQGKVTRIAPEMFAFNAMLEFQLKKKHTRTCDETGCFYIVNDTSDYDAVALHLDTGTPSPRDAPVWGPNLLIGKLKPHTARWTYKAGDETMCALGTRVVLRHRRTAEEVVTNGEVSLRKSPRLDSALRINVDTPRVTLEEPVTH
ncbi:hypothetical protein [Sphingomonas sp. LM7]|uniref:hypothetical protein n=1 Tax=Sphingomonas sp. LM7 TaxID=1938607 RepID=UPI0009839010|nr:hypothetical protein [Sphingomonas sp. LM7]AQR73986.1 hypothetical protein BXU08_10285 [Sphingomonas sp. LM7]